jgi:hypothetical protein
MYLSYTGHKSFSSCPRIYWHQYVNKTRLDVPDNRVNSLFGTIVGGLFETFYSERIWRQSGIEQTLLGLVPAHYRRALVKESRDGAIRWKPDDEKANYETPEALLDDVRSAIPRGLSIIRHHKLLGPTQSEAEVKLDHTIEGHTIGGRADFLIKRIPPHNDLILLDGKGSKWRDKYVDPSQLRWYAMLHRLRHGFMPDKIGFVFWRFEAEQALDWVPFTEADLLELQNGVLDSMKRIEEAKTRLATFQGANQTAALQELFPVSPGDRCRLCAFKPICPEGTYFGSIRAPIPDGAGVEDVGF